VDCAIVLVVLAARHLLCDDDVYVFSLHPLHVVDDDVCVSVAPSLLSLLPQAPHVPI
jgi:hypothetical protein